MAINLLDIINSNNFTKVTNLERKLTYSILGVDSTYPTIINCRCMANSNVIIPLAVEYDEVKEFANPIVLHGTKFKFM